MTSSSSLQGESTIKQRKVLLEKKKASLLDAIKQLEESVVYIDHKQNFYDDVLSGNVTYKSNLINIE